MQVRSVPIRKDDEVTVVRGTYKVWRLAAEGEQQYLGGSWQSKKAEQLGPQPALWWQSAEELNGSGCGWSQAAQQRSSCSQLVVSEGEAVRRRLRNAWSSVLGRLAAHVDLRCSCRACAAAGP